MAPLPVNVPWAGAVVIVNVTLTPSGSLPASVIGFGVSSSVVTTCGSAVGATFGGALPPPIVTSWITGVTPRSLVPSSARYWRYRDDCPIGCPDARASGVVHVVWTNIKADNIVSLSVLDSAAENVLAHTCGDKIVEGAFEAMPINFSQVTPEGLGNFVINDAKYVVEDVLKGGVATVQCVQKNLADAAVLDCVVPLVAGLTLPIVSEVSEIVTCLTSGLPLIGNLPVLASLPL